MRSPGRQLPPRRAVVFHARRLDAAHRRILDAVGFVERFARTGARAARALLEPDVGFVVIDLGCGSHAPERIREALAAAGERRIELLCTADHVSVRRQQRAVALGAERLHPWPDGVVQHLVSAVRDGVGLTLRDAERVVVEEEVYLSPRSASRASPGRIVDLSTSGALVEFQAEPHADGYSFEFHLPGDPVAVVVTARRVRRQEVPEGVRLALQFIEMAPEARERLRDFVRQRKLLRPSRTDDGALGESRKITVRAGMIGEKRVDYFRLCCLEPTRAVLVQEAAFLPPYREGTELELSLWKPARPCRTRAVVEGFETAIDGKTVWHVRLDSTPEAPVNELVAAAIALQRR